MAIREDRVLSAPTVYLDGRKIKVIPGSVKNQLPFEAKVMAVSSGGSSIELVHGINLEAAGCKVEFETASTAEYEDMANEYSVRRIKGPRSTIMIAEDSKQDYYDSAILTNQIEIEHTAEGKIKFEFMARYASAA